MEEEDKISTQYNIFINVQLKAGKKVKQKETHEKQKDAKIVEKKK